MKIAIVHDWLHTLGGAENVLAEMVACYPQADVFTLIDFLDDAARARLGVGRTRVSFLQRMPLVRRHYRAFLPLMPAAIESFDLREYDLVLSSSHAIFGFWRALSCMILEARRLSRRCTIVTFDANLVRKPASSMAVSPPPTTSTSLPL